MLYTGQYLPIGYTCVICQEEEQQHEDVYWLQRAQQSNNQEKVSFAKDRWSVWLVERSSSFSKIDLRFGNHQPKIKPKDVSKTTF